MAAGEHESSVRDRVAAELASLRQLVLWTVKAQDEIIDIIAERGDVALRTAVGEALQRQAAVLTEMQQRDRRGGRTH